MPLRKKFIGTVGNLSLSSSSVFLFFSFFDTDYNFTNFTQVHLISTYPQIIIHISFCIQEICIVGKIPLQHEACQRSSLHLEHNHPTFLHEKFVHFYPWIVIHWWMLLVRNKWGILQHFCILRFTQYEMKLLILDVQILGE